MNTLKLWTTVLIFGLSPLAATANDDAGDGGRCNPVGTWSVNITFPPEANVPPFTELISFLPGGVVLESNSQLHPNSANPFLPFNSSDGYGAWERRRHCLIEFKLLKHVFDPSHQFVGFIRITVKAKIVGNTYSNKLEDSNVELVVGTDPDAPAAMSFGGSTSQGTRVLAD